MSKYHVVSNVLRESKKDREAGRKVAAALSTMLEVGPAAENAILPDRHPSDELAAALGVDVAVEEEDTKLRAIVTEFANAFG